MDFRAVGKQSVPMQLVRPHNRGPVQYLKEQLLDSWVSTRNIDVREEVAGVPLAGCVGPTG